MVGRLGVVVCLVGLNAKHAVISRRMLGHLVAWRGIVVCLVGLNARHAMISPHMTGPAHDRTV